MLKYLLNSTFVSSSVITAAHNEPKALQNPKENAIINRIYVNSIV